MRTVVGPTRTSKPLVRPLLPVLSLLAATLLCTRLVATCQTSPEKPGLPVGKPAPAFTLKDQNDKEVSLSSLLKKGPVALVFFRSAEWCMYCKLQVVQLQQNLKEFEATGGQIVGISKDQVNVLKGFSTRSRITFPLLADVDGKTINAFSIRNQNPPPGKEGSSYHATFVIDQKGIIRSKLFQVSYAERPAVDGLVKALKEAKEDKAVGTASRSLAIPVSTNKETKE